MDYKKSRKPQSRIRKNKYLKQTKESKKIVGNKKLLTNKKLASIKQLFSSKNTPTARKVFVISECYNQKHSELLSSQLRMHLNKLKLVEFPGFRNYDMNALKQTRKNLQNNCNELIKIIKRDKYFNDKALMAKTYDFIWMSPINKLYDKRFYYIKSVLTNLINSEKFDVIGNKGNLFKNMFKQFPEVSNKHLAKTFPINRVKEYDFAKHTYILRPVDSFAGKDILFISNEKELDDARMYYNKNKNYKGVIYGNDVIASEYIMNPLLYKKRKCHLRMYYILSYIDNVFNSFLYPIGDLLTADKDYNTDKPFEKEVHDTHQKSSEDDYFFPRDLEKEGIKTENIFKQMRDILKCTSQIINRDKTNWVYDNFDNGFMVCGIDFMVDDKMNVFLIEVNDKPGYSYVKRENNIYFSKILFDWLNEIILEPTYKYKDQLVARKHQTYLDLD